MKLVSVTQRQTKDEETFWRKLILPEEEHLRMGKPWTGGYRWFRSPNVVPIERWRKQPERRRTPAPKIG